MKKLVKHTKTAVEGMPVDGGFVYLENKLVRS